MRDRLAAMLVIPRIGLSNLPPPEAGLRHSSCLSPVLLASRHTKDAASLSGLAAGG